MKKLILLLLTIFTLLTSAGQLFGEEDFSLSFTGLGYFGQYRFKPGTASYQAVGELAYSNGFMDFLIDFSIQNDGKYVPHSQYQMGNYLLMNNCYIGFNYDNLSLYGGRGIQKDIVDTPYSVYISSYEIPAVFLDLTWDSPRFLYETRWIRLNANSKNTYEGYPAMTYFDRGMTYKVYALKMGAARLGYQDSSVFLFKQFDFESLVSPLPMFFVQMINTTAGRPWSEQDNTNSLMGFFFDISKENWYLQTQILVDDINASILKYLLGDLIPALNSIENLSKVAWSLGGHYVFPFGKIGLYHGGALKHTFPATYVMANRTSADAGDDRPYYSTLPYQYTYYPASRYLSKGSSGDWIDISYVENYIGYKYGENNIAFQADYTNTFLKKSPWVFDFYGSLEYVVSGSKSPANPWHEHDSWLEIDLPVELLNEDVLEHTFILTASAEKPFRAWTFSLALEFGHIWNALVLTEVEGRPDEPWIWRPAAGVNRTIYALTLGVRYSIDLRARETK